MAVVHRVLCSRDLPNNSQWFTKKPLFLSTFSHNMFDNQRKKYAHQRRGSLVSDHGFPHAILPFLSSFPNIPLNISFLHHNSSSQHSPILTHPTICPPLPPSSKRNNLEVTRHAALRSEAACRHREDSRRQSNQRLSRKSSGSTGSSSGEMSKSERAKRGKKRLRDHFGDLIG